MTVGNLNAAGPSNVFACKRSSVVYFWGYCAAWLILCCLSSAVYVSRPRTKLPLCVGSWKCSNSSGILVQPLRSSLETNENRGGGAVVSVEDTRYCGINHALTVHIHITNLLEVPHAPVIKTRGRSLKFVFGSWLSIVRSPQDIFRTSPLVGGALFDGDVQRGEKILTISCYHKKDKKHTTK